MIKTRSTHSTQQEALRKDEIAMRSTSQKSNKLLQEQVTQLKTQISKIEKQADERRCNHQVNSGEEEGKARTILEEVKAFRADIELEVSKMAKTKA